MTETDATKALLLLLMFAGQIFLLLLLSELQRQRFPEWLWSWTENVWDATVQLMEDAWDRILDAAWFVRDVATDLGNSLARLFSGRV